MIYGDPDKIALQFDAVKCWNSYKGSWINGIFSVYIGGNIFFTYTSNILNSTLNIDFGSYQFDVNANLSRATDVYKEIEVEVDLNRRSKDICEEIYDKIYRHMGDKEFRIKNFLDLTSQSLMDEGYHLFCFLLAKRDVVLYGNMRDMGNSKKITLPKNTIRELIEDIAKYPFFPGYYISWGENYHYYP